MKAATTESNPGRQTKPTTEPKSKPRKQPLYNVILHDDDDHSYDYVIGMLRKLFGFPEEKAFEEGKAIVRKLKEFLPAQQFAIALQAIIGGKVIARETINARRKDVTGSLYGGDYSRKRKLLEKQKKGKKLLKEKGRVKIPSGVFLDVYRG